MFVALLEYLSVKIVQLGRIWTLRLELFDICTKGTFFSENLMMLKKICQFTILNFLLKFLKLHFVCFCFAADFQDDNIAFVKKTEKKNSNDEFKIVKMAYLFEPVNNTDLFLKISDL